MALENCAISLAPWLQPGDQSSHDDPPNRFQRFLLFPAKKPFETVSFRTPNFLHRAEATVLMRSLRVSLLLLAVYCNPQTQKQFNRAVAWLHSFEYEEAEKAFTEVTVTDPRCGMAYWGIAMSNYHPIWAPPTAAELQKGWSAVEKARVAGAQTQRERDYIAAIEVFYKDSDKRDHKTRTFAYGD